MILGVNWYRDFPDGLYDYEFFKFKRSPGGFADYPPELVTSVEATDNNILKQKLNSLLNKFDKASVFYKQNGNHSLIEISWYHLYDYDFLFALEVEKMLTEIKAKYSEVSYKESKLEKLGNYEFQQNHYYPKSDFINVVHSAPGLNNSCLKLIRIDGHIKSSDLKNFATELARLATLSNTLCCYYSESKKGEFSNFYVFLTNGRQGVNLNEMLVSDGKQIEKDVDQLTKKYNVKTGFVGDHTNWPTGKKVVLNITDKEFQRLND